MKLIISEGKTVGDVKQDFSKLYPFLKIELYRMLDKDFSVKKHLTDVMPLKPIPGAAGVIDADDTLTVEDLEKSFFEQFGLKAQISRKAGVIWLETTMTANWTLRKQNDHGRELTHATKKRIA